MSTVINQPQFAIHVFAREAEPVSSPILPSDVIRPPYGWYSYRARRPYTLPRRGRWRFSSRRACSRDALSPASRSLPSASWTGRAWPQVPRGPRCNCTQPPAFPRSSRTPPPAGSHGRGSARGSLLSLRTSLTSQSIFLISDCYNTQKLVSDNWNFFKNYRIWYNYESDRKNKS